MDDITAPKNQIVSYCTSMPIWWQIWENEWNFGIWKYDRIFIRNSVWAWYWHTRQYQKKIKEKETSVLLFTCFTLRFIADMYEFASYHMIISISAIYGYVGRGSNIHTYTYPKNKRFNSNIIRCIAIATTNMRKLLFFFSRKSRPINWFAGYMLRGFNLRIGLPLKRTPCKTNIKIQKKEKEKSFPFFGRSNILWLRLKKMYHCSSKKPTNIHWYERLWWRQWCKPCQLIFRCALFIVRFQYFAMQTTYASFNKRFCNI